MKFSKILGEADPSLIKEAEHNLSSIFTELAMNYKTKTFGSKIGGDVFLHQLITPMKHICDVRALQFDQELASLQQEWEKKDLLDEEKDLLIKTLKHKFGKKLLRTASTDGRTFYWAPQFVVKQSKIGLRLLVGHEGWHCIWMHPSRRGSRNPALWNIVVDYKVNFILMEDLKNRGFMNPELIFKQELGDFITLEEYASFLKNPFDPPAKLALWNPEHSLKEMLNPGYKETGTNNKHLFYAEPNLPKDLRRPEYIYEYLYNQIPRCKTCGKPSWKKPKEYIELEKQLNEQRQ